MHLLLIQLTEAIAQRPTHVPGSSGPVDFFESPANVLVYIVMPVIVAILYYVWRKKIKKEREKKNNNQK